MPFSVFGEQTIFDEVLSNPGPKPSGYISLPLQVTREPDDMKSTRSWAC